MHHMTYITDDIQADVNVFRDQGFRVVDEDNSWPHWQEAFLHPRTAHGVLIQLAQSDLTLAEQDQFWGKQSLSRVLELAAQFS
jgi:hypothetical protein